MFRRLGLVVVVMLVVALAAGSVQAGTAHPTAGSVPQQDGQTPEDICAVATENIVEPENRTFKEAEQVLKEGVDYAAVICTAAGPVFIDLLEDESPNTVNNFVFLAQNNFYNNTTFHRVLPSFMAQGGDPTGTGSGGPGYEFANETDNGLTFDKAGMVAMANSGPDTNGSQFFITYVAADWLNGQYNVFGQVLSGIEEAELLLPRDPTQSPTFTGDALQTVVIIEDPSTVTAEPEGVPSIEHFQAKLEEVIAEQVLQVLPLEVVEEMTHVYDLQAEVETWGAVGGDELTAFLSDYLPKVGFVGTAAVVLAPPECTDDMPLWVLAVQVSDYGTNAADVLMDNERADKFVETGAFDSYSDPEGVPGRIFVSDESDSGWCNENAVLYHLEVPQDRYLLTVEAVLDSAVMDEQSSIGFVTDFVASLYLPSMNGTLERGNAAE